MAVKKSKSEKKTEQKSHLVMQIMGATALIMKEGPMGFRITKVGPQFTGVANEGDIVFLIPMDLPESK